MKKILIVHGWSHSSELYQQLKRDLESTNDLKVTLFKFPGFGGTQSHCHSHLLQYYTEELHQVLQEDYDYVIGHSMGGNIVLRVFSERQYHSHLILISPAYVGIDLARPLIFLQPLLYPLLFTVQKIKCGLTDFLIKCTALLTINNWKCITSQVVDDVRRANTITMVNSLIELAWDNWSCDEEDFGNISIDLVLGENDRVISKRKMHMLQQQIPSIIVHIISNIGHTAILEDYNSLLQIILKICNSNNIS